MGIARRPGSDLMVQTLKELGIEFLAANPGSSFEALQESVVNYGTPPNTMPEFITALHEESAVDMASGYGRAEGKPMCALVHGTVGLQHASMAIYQAYYFGTPMVLIAGRDDTFIQPHTANDMAAMVRGFTKWDAQPTTLEGALQALQEAYRQAVTPPTAPTLVVIDTELQKLEAGALTVPKYKPPVISGVDRTAAREIAEKLLGATNPRISVGQLRTPEGVRHAIELAELVGASTSTTATSGPMSFPQRHPLCGPGANTKYDFTLGLETGPADIALVGPRISSLTAARDKSGIGFGGLRAEHGRERAEGGGRRNVIVAQLDVDAEASLPEITRAAKELMTRSHQRVIGERTAKHAAANEEARLSALRTAVDAKRVGWDASPVSTARLYAELWPLIMNEDWCLASPTNFSGAHHRQLWAHDRPYSYLGGAGAAGLGYGAGACAGAALAARARGRFVINVQTDGDLNYAPGALWSAAHHRLPMLTIMHNNRAYHQELMFLEFMAGLRGRGTDRAHIGSTLRNPFIDYKKMAEAYGMAGEGPIDNPNLLQAALRRGLASVKRGEPYMIDVLTQPR
ncbi:MAG TPA: thiamine pyrophosphate-binding protein [Steroidobacteraceae bacterium]|jgi:thiamine pyrophosphate-dependent acetolactate synthase large subunit-like protein